MLDALALNPAIPGVAPLIASFLSFSSKLAKQFSSYLLNKLEILIVSVSRGVFFSRFAPNHNVKKFIKIIRKRFLIIKT